MKRERYRAGRASARAEAFHRDGGRCRWPTCRTSLLLDSPDVYRLAHAHEIHGRSVDDPTDPSKIITVCWQCHSDLHVRIGGKRKQIKGADATTALRFFERLRKKAYHEQAEWHEVGPDPSPRRQHGD